MLRQTFTYFYNIHLVKSAAYLCKKTRKGEANAVYSMCKKSAYLSQDNWYMMIFDIWYMMILFDIWWYHSSWCKSDQFGKDEPAGKRFPCQNFGLNGKKTWPTNVSKVCKYISRYINWMICWLTLELDLSRLISSWWYFIEWKKHIYGCLVRVDC